MPSPHHRKRQWLVVALALFSLSQTRDADAQATHRLEIHYPEVTEGASALSVGLYFTVLDAGGQVLTDAQVVDAEVAMEDGSVYEAAVAKPSPETYVVLVLDGSGSMVGSINQLRQAAVQAVQAAPEKASG